MCVTISLYWVGARKELGGRTLAAWSSGAYVVRCLGVALGWVSKSRAWEGKCACRVYSSRAGLTLPLSLVVSERSCLHESRITQACLVCDWLRDLIERDTRCGRASGTRESCIMQTRFVCDWLRDSSSRIPNAGGDLAPGTPWGTHADPTNSTTFSSPS